MRKCALAELHLPCGCLPSAPDERTLPKIAKKILIRAPSVHLVESCDNAVLLAPMSKANAPHYWRKTKCIPSTVQLVKPHALTINNTSHPTPILRGSSSASLNLRLVAFTSFGQGLIIQLASHGSTLA